ncbi:metal-dependent hydrolase [Thermofilum sp.]|jgi:L-ascorbate metabolism protein UlaG (beta-lactamase superfamily)|uniref:metal-dependent hydrolase n=1 Tax=Thermofilum sp. TaxID=1961369 RepID=UPI00258609CE|nr:metal-dependent hydrolase [Thermofilum sp.]
MAIITFLGHAAFELVLKGLDGQEKKVLIDPWLENPLSPVKPSAYRGTRVDYIIVTHDHGDHLGNSFEIAKMTGAKFVAVYELAEEASSQGIEAIGANVGGPLSVPDLKIVFTPAVHSSSKGTPTGVVVSSKDATIYHAGDTGLFGDMALIGELYKPDVALLPIGGHFTMGIHEAAKAVQLIKPRIAIPMHYNTFPVIRADPEEFKQLVEKTTSTRVVVLKPGERYTL